MLLFEADALRLIFALSAATVASATPLILAAMGGILSERAGIVNIALEGFLVTGAFVGVFAGRASGWAGLAAAALVGGLFGLLHGFLTQKLKVDHVVSGLGINLLAAGATRFFALRWFGTEGVTVTGVPSSVFITFAVMLPFCLHFVLYRMRFGLRLRAVGENPETARMAGIDPLPLRYVATGLCGMLGGIAGAFLSLGESHTFSSNMSAGKGYIALAAVIFGKWKPAGAALAALLFGFCYALQSQLQISGAHLHWLGIEWSSPALLDMLPYVITLLALVTIVGRATPPAALGKEG